MSLVNLAWGKNFFWDGRARSLAEQAVFPIMNMKELCQPMSELCGELERHPLYPKMFELAFGDPKIDVRSSGVVGWPQVKAVMDGCFGVALTERWVRELAKRAVLRCCRQW